MKDGNSLGTCAGCGCAPCRYSLTDESRCARREATRVLQSAGEDHDPTAAAYLDDDPIESLRPKPVDFGVDLSAGRSRASTVVHVDGSLSTVAVQAIELIAVRDAAGQKKYGVSMDRADLKPGAWLRHAIEEHADALQYQLRLALELEHLVRKAFQAGVERGLSSLGSGDYAYAIAEIEPDAADDIVKELLG